jgi:predicted RNase H-like HicB family nuclease
MNRRYEIIISWSQEDGCFVAKVPDLPGCMADGQSYQEAASNAEAAMKEWIELAVELGRAIPEPRNKPGYA